MPAKREDEWHTTTYIPHEMALSFRLAFAYRPHIRIFLLGCSPYPFEFLAFENDLLSLAFRQNRKSESIANAKIVP